MLAENRKDISSSQSGNSELQIVLVDDSEMLQEIISEAIGANLPDIKTHFYETAQSENALDAISQSQSNLVFIDWDTSDLDCIELVQHIRQIDNSIPIVMITAQIEEEKLLKAGDAGVNAYIEKPIRSQQLWNQIKEFIL